VGLLLVLLAAVVIGTTAGLYIGGMSTPPRYTPPPIAPRAQSPSRKAERPERERAQKARVETTEVPKPEPARPSPTPTPRPVTRHKGLAGEVSHVSGAGTKIALTFDAGASPVPTPAILDALRSAGVHVTFFLTGKWCERNEGLVRRIRAEGHEIGNHTYSHKDLRKLSDEEIEQELRQTNDIVARITGSGCDPYFRPPYGGRDKRVLKVAADAGYNTVYWAVDSWDAFKKGITADEIRSRVLDRAEGGDVVLLHCGSQPTAEALPGLIRELKSRGCEIVTISELLRSR
jgi:peptidoglycan/xylan/chitin deacetylase (PgdA/CDA1 family)